MFSFTFISDHNTDSLMLYSVQLKNMYSYLNSSLKLSDGVGGVSVSYDLGAYPSPKHIQG